MKDNRIRIYQKNNQQLYFSNGEKENEVRIKQCFPWSIPDKFLSLRNSQDDEVYIINDINDLDIKMQRVIKNYLKSIEFVLEIKDIIKIEEDFELRRYEVLTLNGQRTFQTKLDEWPLVKDNGNIYIEDVAGDIFFLKTVNNLGPKGKKLLSTYIS